MSYCCEFCEKIMEYEEFMEHLCDEQAYHNWQTFKAFEQSCLSDPNIIVAYNSELSI